MANLTIKGISETLLKKLRRKALLNHRSLNGEVLRCLEQAASAPAVDPERWLAQADRLRTRLSLAPTDRQLKKARSKGRP